MKKILVILLACVFIIPLAACGGAKYTIDSKTLDLKEVPKDYPLIATEKMQKSYDELWDSNSFGKVKTYEDVVKIFGQDGAYFKNCDKEVGTTKYAYYAWFGEGNKSIIVTFRKDGDKLIYFAFSTGSLTPSKFKK